MAQRGVKLRAVLEWAKVFKENRDKVGYKATDSVPGTYEQYDGACTVNIILDNENMELLKATGFPRTFKPDSEGRGMVTKVDRKFNSGFDFSSGAPEIYKAGSNKLWNFEDGELGNGTIADVYLSVYDTKYGTVGSRLDRIDVHELVEHTGSSGVPVYESVGSPPPVKAANKVLEDEIPF